MLEQFEAMDNIDTAGVFCRMQNGLYGQWYQCEAKCDAHSLAQKLLLAPLHSYPVSDYNSVDF